MVEEVGGDALAGYAYEAGVACCETLGACWTAAGHPGIMAAAELGGKEVSFTKWNVHYGDGRLRIVRTRLGGPVCHGNGRVER